jgi:phosphate starvation-inducible protein PhoH
MAKKKNLSQDDFLEVKNYESAIQRTSSNRKIQIKDINLNIPSLTPKQEELRKIIKDKDITITIGSAGCLIKSEKIKIYRLKN